MDGGCRPIIHTRSVGNRHFAPGQRTARTPVIRSREVLRTPSRAPRSACLCDPAPTSARPRLRSASSVVKVSVCKCTLTACRSWNGEVVFHQVGSRRQNAIGIMRSTALWGVEEEWVPHRLLWHRRPDPGSSREGLLPLGQRTEEVSISIGPRYAEIDSMADSNDEGRQLQTMVEFEEDRVRDPAFAAIPRGRPEGPIRCL